MDATVEQIKTLLDEMYDDESRTIQDVITDLIEVTSHANSLASNLVAELLHNPGSDL